MHSNRVRIKCEVCGLDFTDKCNLTAHFKRVHCNIKNKIKIQKEVGFVSCFILRLLRYTKECKCDKISSSSQTCLHKNMLKVK